MSEIDKERLYIYNLFNREKTENLNTTILYFLRNNDICCTENKNGFFLNLSTLEDEYVTSLYSLIRQIGDYKTQEIPDYSSDDSSTGEDTDSNPEDPIIFSDKEKVLIEYTKTI